MLAGILLSSNWKMAAQTTFHLYLVKRLIVTLRCALNVNCHVILPNFSLKFKCKICVQKEVMHSLASLNCPLYFLAFD